jgi:hypothetical protein
MTRIICTVLLEARIAALRACAERRPFAQSRIGYADVGIGGSALRLPSRGWASTRGRGASRAIASRASATITYTYRDFEPPGSK